MMDVVRRNSEWSKRTSRCLALRINTNMVEVSTTQQSHWIILNDRLLSF